MIFKVVFFAMVLSMAPYASALDKAHAFAYAEKTLTCRIDCLSFGSPMEAASIQDLYQTPVIGTALGYGIEIISTEFLNRDSSTARLLGRLINPFSLLVNESAATLVPVLGPDWGFGLKLKHGTAVWVIFHLILDLANPSHAGIEGRIVESFTA